MINFKAFFTHNLNQAFFALCLLVSLFLSAALTLIPLPFFFIETPLFVHFYGIFCFFAFICLPARFWFCFILPSLWLDLMLQTFLGFHTMLMIIQAGSIFLMKRFLKDYGFLSNWSVFSLSYVVIFNGFNMFSFFQSFPTIFLYPLLFYAFVKGLYKIRWLNYG